MTRPRHQGPLKETCLCNMHVHNGTKIIAYLNLAFQIVSVLFLSASLIMLFLGGSLVGRDRDHVVARNGDQAVTRNGDQAIARNGDKVVVQDRDGVVVRDRGMPNTIVGLIWTNIIPIIMLIIGLVVTVLLLQGVKKRNPKLYIPYLVWTVIGIAIMVISLLFMIITTLLVFLGVMASSDHSHTAAGTVFGTSFLITVILLLIALSIHVYFGFIVPNRSRQLLEAEVLPVTNRQVHNVPVGHTNAHTINGQYNPDNVTVVETRTHQSSAAYKPDVY